MVSRRFPFPDYLATLWPIATTLMGVFGVWLLLFGNPLEIVELRWLGQLLRWRAATGIAPSVDSRARVRKCRNYYPGSCRARGKSYRIRYYIRSWLRRGFSADS